MNQVLLNKYLLSELYPVLSFINRLTTEESNLRALSQCSQNARCFVKNSENLGFHLVLDAILLLKKKKKKKAAKLLFFHCIISRICKTQTALLKFSDSTLSMLEY